VRPKAAVALVLNADLKNRRASVTCAVMKNTNAYESYCGDA
jgi:hypothetical protein